MKIAVAVLAVPHFIKTPFELGEWVAFEGKDCTMFAEVQCIDINPRNGRIKVLGVWGNDSVMTAGDKGWQWADQCRKATEEERYLEERRRVFAAKGRRNNEFHSGDFVSDDNRALIVAHQNKETGVVLVMIINTNEQFEIEPQELEMLFFAEDMAG